MKRVIITGSNGFVAHHIVEHILKNTDWEIVGLDRLSNPNNHGYDKLRDINVFDDSRVRLLQHDLQQPIGEGLAHEIGKIDYILHIASGSHVDNSIKDPVPFIKNNIDITLTMLEYARKYPVEKFLYFSTDEVYGTAPEGYNYHEGDRFNPGNPYSASKASSECICYAYANTYKLPIIITNGMNIIGERQHPEKFLPKIINYVLDDKELTIHGDSTGTRAALRHYIHARNVASAVLFVLTKTDETLDSHDASKGKFFISGEKELDNLAFAKLIAEYVGKPLKYKIVSQDNLRPGHDFRYALSKDKLKSLGWEPPTKLEDSIKNIVEWSLKEENKKWLRVC